MNLEKEGEKGDRVQEQIQIEIDPRQEQEGEEEQVMKKLLQGWKHLDE